MAAKTTLTTPKSIRNLQLVSPEGVVGVWNDKKDDGKFYVAVTTKAAGWSEFSQRAHLEGPMTQAEMLDKLAGLKKRGEVALAHVTEVLAERQLAAEAEVERATQIAEMDAEREQVIEMTEVDEPELVEAGTDAHVINDPMFGVFVERAKGRTPERNRELVVEVAGEIEALTVKITETDDPELVAKITFNLHRKEVLIEALKTAIA